MPLIARWLEDRFLAPVPDDATHYIHYLNFTIYFEQEVFI